MSIYTFRLKNMLAVIFVNLLMLLLLFFLIEVIFRAFYPEFSNHIHSNDVTLGKNKYYNEDGNINSTAKIRVPFPGYDSDRSLSDANNTVLVLGDSVTDGYGTAYEDIYHVQFERMANLLNDYLIDVVPLSMYGNNLTDSLEMLKHYDKGMVKLIIYQFNYNDITPYSSKSLKKISNNDSGFVHNFSFVRYKYLNKSVFLRVFQHYLGNLIANRFGTCSERGKEALRSYTWSYGHIDFADQSKKLWLKLDADIKSIKEISDSIGAKFAILISPILYDIDEFGYHLHYNSRNLDFSCATINPNEKVKQVALRNKVDVIDPTKYIRDRFESRSLESNFEPFYFAADDNHFTPIVSRYIAEYLYAWYRRGL